MDGFSRANCDVSESLITEDFDADVLELYTTLTDFTGKGFNVDVYAIDIGTPTSEVSLGERCRLLDAQGI